MKPDYNSVKHNHMQLMTFSYSTSCSTITNKVTMIIGNSIWTEWSTIIQKVFMRVISLQGWFEIMSMITPWIVQHKVQLLINCIYNKFLHKNVFWEFLLQVTLLTLLISFENSRKHCKGSSLSMHNWCENHEGIQLQVSNYKRFISDTCYWTPIWSRTDYVTNRWAENQSQSRNLLYIGLV